VAARAREAEAAAAHRANAGRRWTGAPRLSIGTALALIVVAADALSLGASTTTTEATTTTVPLQSAATPSWTVYHGDPTGSGVAASVTAVDVSSPAWTSPALDGDLFGEPLVSGGRVFVATENDTVDALSATTGAVMWSTHLATPVLSGSLPCGDISPTVGITGTPVVDERRGELFVVADELVHGRPAHQLVGLSTATGTVELNQNVDPSGSTPAALLQRTGLTLDAGRVVFGYGGNYGDCSTYHGWVLAVPEAGGTPATFGVDSAPGESQGAVWMGGAAPVVDAGGNIWVTVGNGSVYSSSHAYDNSDSVLQLSPSLALEQYFAPSSWPSDNAHDLDMSTAAALLGDGQVVAAGKARIVFLLNGSSLGGIGGQQAKLADACGSDIDGGVAVVGTTVYLPCLSGPIAVQASASPAGLRPLWSASVGGGPPVVAGGLVWTIGADGVLYGLNPSSGTVLKRVTIGAAANHFPTPSVGAGLLLAPSADHVVAFRASSAPATRATTTTTGRTTRTTAAAAQPGSTSPWVVVAAVLGGLAVVSALTWLLRRRRRGTRDQ
jgi:outer membrane protein assembly factor BamB